MPAVVALLRRVAPVKFRHATEVLIIGFGSNYLLPARLGEVPRADYGGRLFEMSHFTSDVSNALMTWFDSLHSLRHLASKCEQILASG